jgi:hypothetical protein
MTTATGGRAVLTAILDRLPFCRSRRALRRVVEAAPLVRRCELCKRTQRVLLLRNGGLICEPCRNGLEAYDSPKALDSIGE